MRLRSRPSRGTRIEPTLDRATTAEVAGRRRAASRLTPGDDRITARIETAPPAYVLVQHDGDLVRQCGLLDPRPGPAAVRLIVTPAARPGEWLLDVAAQDRVGLLASVTGVLTDAGIEVVRAVLATWPDGTALQALAVRSRIRPDARVLQPALQAALADPVTSGPLPDAEVTFDQRPSSPFTACSVTAADHPGVLHAIATAFAATGIDIHGASVTTVDGLARDRFDLTDRAGNRVGADRRHAFVATLHAGVRDSVDRVS